MLTQSTFTLLYRVYKYSLIFYFILYHCLHTHLLIYIYIYVPYGYPCSIYAFHIVLWFSYFKLYLFNSIYMRISYFRFLRTLSLLLLLLFIFCFLFICIYKDIVIMLCWWKCEMSMKWKSSNLIFILHFSYFYLYFFYFLSCSYIACIYICFENIIYI